MAEVSKDAVAKAKEEAAAKKAAAQNSAEDVAVKAQAQADDIVAKAKEEAAAILAEARGSAGDVAYKGVTKKQLVDGYNEGKSHMRLAEEYFGSRSEESIAKVAAVIDKEFGLTEDIDAKRDSDQ